MRLLRFVLTLALLAGCAGLRAQAPTLDAALAAGLQNLEPGRLIGRSESLGAAVQSIYRSNGVQPLWVKGRLLNPSANVVHAKLAAASLHGLDAEDYRTRWLGERLAGLRDRQPTGDTELARLDITLTLALLRYLSDLRNGRASIRQISGVWVASPAGPDTGALLRASSDPRALQQLIEDAAPAYPIYRRLLKARVVYEALVAGHHEAPRLPAVGDSFRLPTENPDELRIISLSNGSTIKG